MHIRKGTRHKARKKKLKTVKNMYLVRKKHTNKDKENNCVSIDKSKRSHISYSDSRDLNKILKITEKNVL